jgi:hypothetical protein
MPFILYLFAKKVVFLFFDEGFFFVSLITGTLNIMWHLAFFFCITLLVGIDIHIVKKQNLVTFNNISVVWYEISHFH